MTGIALRLKILIDAKTDRRGKFAQLEELTGITIENWKSFYYGRQRPNPDMIEAVARQWPECAFWLATNISDRERGHNDPWVALPITGTLEELCLERTGAGRVFRAEIERRTYIDQRLAENPAFEEDDQLVKMEAQLARLRRLRDEEERTMTELEKDR